jgi:hypothetical protein
MTVTALLAPRRALASVAAVAAAAAGAAGCGSSSGAGDTDPATRVPASAPVYVEAVVRPGDEQVADAQGALRKILRTTDPGAKLAGLVDEAGRERDVTWEKDIDPWLGDRVGAAMLSVGGAKGGDEKGDGVVVAASSDDDKAAGALEKLVPKADQRTHKDVDYRYAREDETAGAVLDGTVLVGSERGVKAAIDASEGASLADADGLKKARASVDEERLGFLFVDTARLLRASLNAAGPGAQQSAAPFLDSVAKALPTTVGAGIDAEPGALRIDSAAIGGAKSTATGDGSAALAALPSDAWLGIGMADLGATLTTTLEEIGSAGGLGAVGLEALLRQAEQQIGLDIRRDLLAWMGGAGIYVAGTSKSEARGGLIVTSKDPAATRRAVRRLATLARRSGDADVSGLDASGVDEGFIVRGKGDDADVYVASAGDTFVVAAGPRALTDALKPSGKLGDAPALRDGASKLGGDVKPSFFLDMKRVTRLMESEKRSDPQFRQAKPYLDAFGAIVGGSSRDGDTTRGRAVATLP